MNFGVGGIDGAYDKSIPFIQSSMGRYETTLKYSLLFMPQPGDSEINIDKLFGGDDRLLLTYVQADAYLQHPLRNKLMVMAKPFKEYIQFLASEKNYMDMDDLEDGNSIALVGGGAIITMRNFKATVPALANINDIPYSSEEEALADLKAGKVKGILTVCGKGAGVIARAAQEKDTFMIGEIDFKELRNHPYYSYGKVTKKDYPTLFGWFSGTKDALTVPALVVCTKETYTQAPAIMAAVQKAINHAAPSIRNSHKPKKK